MRKVIIINDSRLERAVLKDQLTKLGFKVEAADEYNWFSKVSGKDTPSIAIVNYTMQEITGDKIISTINSNFPQVKCYLSSCNELDKNDFKDIQLVNTITTPITLGDLDSILVKVSFCPFCGKELKGNFHFCPFCGQELAI
ncbi:MAG TPA: response regulator [Syntrophomonadaceae bacterium]|nr:response regulator [Syntrophomonadaceae bacterium]